jgi:hypothetical protein
VKKANQKSQGKPAQAERNNAAKPKPAVTKAQTVRPETTEETTSSQRHHMKGSSLDTANHRTA